MKVVVIWDIHWRDIWKEIVKKEDNSNRFIFLWDYFDSFDISVEDQINNFRDIVKFKRENNNKVTLLIWNHDLHYFPSVDEVYSWFNPIIKLQISEWLEDLRKSQTLEYITTHENYLFSHAWVSRKWKLWKFPESYLFKKWDSSMNGNHPEQWPMWIRPLALLDNLLDNRIQVVWHTQVKWIEFMTWVLWRRLILADSLANWEYLIIDNWKEIIWTLK